MYRPVLLDLESAEVGDIVQFYNREFLPRLEELARRLPPLVKAEPRRDDDASNDASPPTVPLSPLPQVSPVQSLSIQHSSFDGLVCLHPWHSGKVLDCR